MNLKKYFTIVSIVLLIFISAVSGILLAQYLTEPFGDDSPVSVDDEILQALNEKEVESKCNILILGTDNDELRTDVIMLCQINKKNDEVNILSVPRDTRVKIGNSYQKINAAYSIGKEKKSIETVRTLTGIPIHHYAVVNFKAFRDIIDALGGVEFDVPKRMKYSDPYQDLYINLQPGLQILDGDKAEQLIRYRQYPLGDVERINVQQAFLKELVQQKLTAKYILQIPKIYDIVSDNIRTDMSPAELLSYGKQVLSIDPENITTYTMPGEGKMIGDASYFVHNEVELSDLVNNVFNNRNKSEEE